MRRALGVGLLILPALIACAKREPPSGGPPDIVPPRVLSSAPDSGTAGVRLDAPITITFTEGMEPRSTEESVELSPRVEIVRRRWNGRTLTLVLAESLRAGHTYTLSVGGTARDRHGNPLGGGTTRVFSTAASFPPGRIAGRLEARGLTAEGVALWCYRAEPGRAPDSTARDFDALGLADRDGEFRIDGLDVPGRYRLWAFGDLNRNRSFEPDVDVLAPVDTIYELTASRPVVEDLRLRVVNPRASGRVRGAVLDSLADTAGVIRVVAVSQRDTSRRVIDAADPEGAFELQLDPGPWVLRAFRDHDGNQIWNLDEEPASDPLPIEVEPAADVVEIRLTLRRPPGG